MASASGPEAAESRKRKRHYHSISVDQRQHICYLLDNEVQSRQTIAEALGIPLSTISSIYKRYCETGETQPHQRGGHKHHILDHDDIEALKGWIDENPTRSLEELKQDLLDLRGKAVSTETVRRYTVGFHYSLKRVQFIAAAADTEELWNRRTEYSEWFLGSDWKLGSVVFLDETGFNISMRRTRGRSLVSSPARVTVPFLKSRNITVIAAVNCFSLLHYKILDHPANAATFEEFLHELVEKLTLPSFIIADNARFHHSASVTGYMESTPHTYKFLPAYSPFFNPIECFFSEWKALVKSSDIKSEPELFRAIDAIKLKDLRTNCHNYFQHVNSNCIECLKKERNLT